MTNNLFQCFALGPKEQLIVQAIVDHGVQPASRIAKFCGLPRNTARAILDKLVSRGILFRSLRIHTQYYGLERKETLLALLRHEKEELQRELDEKIAFVSGLSDDFGKRRTGGRPRVTVYEGLEGLRRVYEDTLTATTGIRSWASFDENQKAMPKYFTTYYRRRAKRGIPMRSIHPDSVLARAHQKNDKKERRSSILVSASHFTCRPEIQVYNDKINIVSWQDRIGIIIESSELAEALRSIFDLSFEGAKRLKTRA